MAKLFDAITPDLHEWIEEQHLFFVATAPLDAEGHVNLSPKGLDCFAVLGPNQVAYLDLTGSGNETSAHLLENGRITLMFCAFSGPPRILRLYGKGRVVMPESDEWETLRGRFPDHAGARHIIAATIDRVQTSCGFGVPLLDYRDQRDTLIRWAESKGEAALEDYRAEKNRVSMDGLPTSLSLAETVG